MLYRINIYTYIYQNPNLWKSIFKNIKNKTKKRNSDTCKVALLSCDLIYKQRFCCTAIKNNQQYIDIYLKIM